MKIDLFCPNRKQVEYAKNIGIDIFNALKLIAKFSVENILNKKSKTVSIDFDENQAKLLESYGVDLPEHLSKTYVDEVKHCLDQEWVKGCPESKLSEITEETIEAALNTMDRMGWSKIVVTNASVASFIQESNKFSPILNIDCADGGIYKVGTYENCGACYEFYVDPRMCWEDSRMIFIKEK